MGAGVRVRDPAGVRVGVTASARRPGKREGAEDGEGVAFADRLGVLLAAPDRVGVRVAARDFVGVRVGVGDLVGVRVAARDLVEVRVTAGDLVGVRVAARDFVGVRVAAGDLDPELVAFGVAVELMGMHAPHGADRRSQPGGDKAMEGVHNSSSHNGGAEG